MEIKKIIALSSSPSKGWNSDSMLDAFIEGAQSIQGIEVEKIYTSDITCDHYSFAHKDGALEHEKDFKGMLDSITHAKGLVIATPTYNFGVPAGLKNIIDRLRPVALDMKKINLLGQPTGKLGYLKTFFLISGGSPGWVQKFLFAIFPPFWLWVVFTYYGAQTNGSIYGGGLKATNLAKDNVRLLNKCRRAGKRFAKKLK